jgi:hypothetical protein
MHEPGRIWPLVSLGLEALLCPLTCPLEVGCHSCPTEDAGLEPVLTATAARCQSLTDVLS